MIRKETYIGNILKCMDTTKNNSSQTIITTYNYLPNPEQKVVNFNLYRFRNQCELHKRNATLIKVGNGIYIDKDNIKSILDYFKLLVHKNSLSKIGFTLIGTFPVGYSSLFVEEGKLKKKTK